MLTTGQLTTWPAGYSQVLDGCRPQTPPYSIGTPILLSSRGEIDEWLVVYFNTCPKFTSLDISSKKTYAREIAMWCAFLGRQDVPTTWLEASPEDFIDYKIRRTTHQLFDDAVAGSTWNKAVFAIRDLYSWAICRGVPISPGGPAIEVNPVPSGVGATRVPGGRANAAFVRQERDRWIVPGTYRLWRDVGIRGRRAERVGEREWRAGPEDKSSRVRNTLRNSAFTDFLYSTGLRVQEAGCLLLPEIPANGAIEARLPSSIAKYGKSRTWYGAPAAIQTLRSYVAITRAAAVRRALREGRYDAIDDVIWVTEVRRNRKGRLEALGHGGKVMALDNIKPDVRRRLFWVRDGQPEPMALWLSEAGTPFHHESWIGVFDEANDRFFAELESTGGAAQDELNVTPHSLRFSFALALAVQLHQRLDKVNGWENMPYGDGSRYDEVFWTVKDVLGHKFVDTTRNTYMPRVHRLRFDRVFGLPHGSEVTTGTLISALVSDLLEVRNLTGSGT